MYKSPENKATLRLPLFEKLNSMVIKRQNDEQNGCLRTRLGLAKKEKPKKVPKYEDLFRPERIDLSVIDKLSPEEAANAKYQI